MASRFGPHGLISVSAVYACAAPRIQTNPKRLLHPARLCLFPVSVLSIGCPSPNGLGTIRWWMCLAKEAATAYISFFLSSMVSMSSLGLFRHAPHSLLPTPASTYSSHFSKLLAQSHLIWHSKQHFPCCASQAVLNLCKVYAQELGESELQELPLTSSSCMPSNQ